MNRKPVYYVNKEKGITVCELRGCSFDAYAIMSKNISIMPEIKPELYSQEELLSIITSIPDEFIMHDSYKGVAKVQDGDTYNEELGKKLAYHKAMIKYNIALLKKANIMKKSYVKFVNENLKSFNKVITETETKAINSQASFYAIFNKTFGEEK